MNIATWLATTAEAHPDRPALFLGKEAVADYGAFHDQALRVAAWLVRNGVQPGERVAIFMQNLPDYLIVQYGIWCAGAACVPINAKLHGREAAWIIDNADARLCFVSAMQGVALAQAGTSAQTIDVQDKAFADILQSAPLPRTVARAPQDMAWLFYTSGTTGRPKGVVITHGMLTHMSRCYLADVDAVSAADTALYAAPLSHGAGLYNMLHVQAGASHVFPVSGGFDPREILDLARHFERVHMFAAPTMVRRLTEVARTAGETGAGLRTVVYAGGPMYLADILAAVDHFGPIFVQIYGQGECPMGITALSRDAVADRTDQKWRARLASVGRAQSGIEVQIGDARGNPLPTGSHGEIMVRGDTVMPGYWNNPQATANTLIGGWLMTGDMGFLDADGYLTLQDRSRDVIITGGSNVYPREVEEVLLTHPDIREASVVGRPHPDWGEEVVAFVVGQVDAASLDRVCNENIARFKRPKAYIHLAELPKNNYGKVLKSELRSLLSTSSETS